MSEDEERFSKPFNWCDRQCERCPLEARCPLVLREKQQRWQDEARGIDPDAPGRDWEHAMMDLDRVIALAEQTAREEGIDLDAPLPPQLVMLDAERLDRAALRIAECIKIDDADDEGQIGALQPAFKLLMKLAGKIARVGSHMSAHDEVWTLDGEPNLLLVEHVDRELRRELERVRLDPDAAVAAAAAVPPAPTPLRSVHAQGQAQGLALARARRARVQEQAEQALAALDVLDRLLAPLLARISAEARAELAARVAAGDAPSPFLVRDGGDPSADPGDDGDGADAA